MEVNDCWWSCRRGDVKDTVGVDVGGDFDLRNTKECWCDTGEVKLAENVVVLGAGTFTLDANEQTELVVGVGGENLGLLGRDGDTTCTQMAPMEGTQESVEAPAVFK